VDSASEPRSRLLVYRFVVVIQQFIDFADELAEPHRVRLFYSLLAQLQPSFFVFGLHESGEVQKD